MSSSIPPPRPRRPGFLGGLYLLYVLEHMAARNRRGADAEIIKVAEAYRRRWKGNAVFYSRLAGAHWGASHWREAVRYGRRALAIDSNRPQTVVFMLAAYREYDPVRGIAFGERWLASHRASAKVCRHLSFLYDDLDRPAEALAAARRGWKSHRRDRRLVGCIASYLAKTEGAASALRFAAEHRRLIRGDTYCEKTLANGLCAVKAYAEAEKIFARLRRRHPDDEGIFVAWLDAVFRLDRHAEMLAEIEAWQRRRPLSAAVANEAGRAHLELGRGDEAVAWMNRAVALAPGEGKYADNLAVTLGRVGRHADGIEAVRRRLAAPGTPDRRRLLASIAADLTHLGRHAEALPYYERAYAEFPGSDDALIDLMIGLDWLSRYAETVTLGRPARDTKGRRMPARFWSELAWALHNTGEFAEEERTIHRWGELFPHDVEVVRTMKRVLNRLERREEALTLARGWIDAHPTVARGWRYLAEQYGECGHRDEEIAAATEAARLAPDEPDFTDAMLAVLRQHDRAREAYELGTAWIAAHPGRATAALLNRTGLAADDLERWTEAEDFYRRAHLAEPGESVWMGNLLRALILQKRAAEAAGLGCTWIAAHPLDNYMAGKQAWALRAAGRLADETAILRQAVQTNPPDEDLNYDLLTSLIRQQRTVEAGEWLARCQAVGQATSRLHNDWANHLRELNRHAEAEAAYRQALATGPDNDTAAGNLASLFVLCDRCDEAVAFCNEWLARRPDDRYVQRQLANALYTMDDFAAAEPHFRALHAAEPASAHIFGRYLACLRLADKFEEVLTLGPDWLRQYEATAFVLVEMGIAAYHTGKHETALAHYDAALALEAGYHSAAIRKLRLLGELERLDLAIEFGEKWSAEHVTAVDADFENRLGILSDRAGRTEAAEHRFRKAAELAPQDATFTANAVEIVTRQGRLDEGIGLGQRFLANNPPNDFLLRRMAEAYSKRHEHDAALDLLATADTLDPRDPEIALAFMRIAQDGEDALRGVEFGRAWLARSGNEQRAAVWARLARLCFGADHDEEAFTAIGQAAALEPDEVAHARTRFGFWNALGDSSRLVKEFETLRPAWQEDATLLRYVSRAYRALGLEVEALEFAQRNVAVNPADDEACAWLVELHDRSGRADEARECLRVWIDVHGEQPAVLKARARLALREKDCASALADAENVLAHDESDEDAFVLVVRALRGLDRGAEARQRLHRWLEYQGASSRINRLLDDEPDGDED